MTRTRLLVLSSALVLALGANFALTKAKEPGCRAYVPSGSLLVAHAGGGLPDKTYANDLEALNLAAKHGFQLIELDFMERDGRLTIGHDGMPESTLKLDGLIAWMDRHPQVSIVTDVKTDNVSGLALLKQAAGPRINRFIPQIYHPDEYAPVTALGYPAPILTVYRMGDEGWQQKANDLPLRAVTMPVARKYLASQVRHPVFLHTVNQPMDGFGLYTDCLVPKGGGNRT